MHNQYFQLKLIKTHSESTQSIFPIHQMDNTFQPERTIFEEEAYHAFLNALKLMPHGSVLSLVIENNPTVVESGQPNMSSTLSANAALQQIQSTFATHTEGVEEDNGYLSDRQFMARIYEYVAVNIEKESLSIDDLVHELALSRTQLFRKIKTVADTTPAQLIRDYRLDTAYHLIRTDKTRRISEVMYAVGFNDTKHFGKIFKQRFGLSPQKVKK